MNKLLSTISLVALILFFIFILGSQSNIFAQETGSETAAAEANQIANADENISADTLGVEEPTLLPNNPFYFIKNWGRSIKSVFTFGAVKKAELRMRFANEKIIEAKKVAEITGNAEAVKEALDNYQGEIKQVQNKVEAIKNKAVEQTKIEEVLNKLTNVQFQHQKLLDRIEKNLPIENLAEIKLVKEETAQKLSETTLKFEQPEQFKERIIKVMETQAGSQFKNFKNLEVLKVLEEKVPEQAREAIRQAAENSLNRLQGDLEKMSPEDRAKFKDYLGAVSGNEIRHIEIIDELQARDMPQAVQNTIEDSKETVTKRIDKKLEAITSPQAKEAFFGHLKEGGLEEFRVINELENNLTPERMKVITEIKDSAIEKTKQLFKEAEVLIKKFENLLPDWLNKEVKPQIKLEALLQDAKDRLERARLALAEQKYGEAHGQLTSAMNLARKGIAIITDDVLITDVLITLERTACFGTCPVYKLTISGDGKIIYEGTRFVNVTGIQTSQISQDKIKDLVDEFYNINYFALNDKYDALITDMPTTITSITIDGRTKKVINYYGAPKKLNELENKIDEITDSKKWVEGIIIKPEPVKPSEPITEPVRPKPIPREDIFCTEQYDPVCGSDGETYPNKCYATRAGVEAVYRGKCGEESVPPPPVPFRDFRGDIRNCPQPKLPTPEEEKDCRARGGVMKSIIKMCASYVCVGATIPLPMPTSTQDRPGSTPKPLPAPTQSDINPETPVDKVIDTIKSFLQR